MAIFDCDFNTGYLDLKKAIHKHHGVVGLRYLEKEGYLLSIGKEGNVYVYKVDDDYNVIQNYKLIWEDVTTVYFMNDNSFLAGIFFNLL